MNTIESINKSMWELHRLMTENYRHAQKNHQCVIYSHPTVVTRTKSGKFHHTCTNEDCGLAWQELNL